MTAVFASAAHGLLSPEEHAATVEAKWPVLRQALQDRGVLIGGPPGEVTLDTGRGTVMTFNLYSSRSLDDLNIWVNHQYRLRIRYNWTVYDPAG